MLASGLILAGGWWWSRLDTARTTLPAREERVAVAVPETAAPGVPAAPAAATAPRIDPPPEVEKRTENPHPLTVVQPPVLPYLSEMSADFQAGLPALRFSGHVYSEEPGLRLIMINDSVLRQGQQILPGLTLAEITERGVILRAGDTPFKIDLF